MCKVQGLECHHRGLCSTVYTSPLIFYTHTGLLRTACACTPTRMAHHYMKQPRLTPTRCFKIWLPLQHFSKALHALCGS